MLVKLNDGRVKDVPVTQVTKENYIVEENEKHLYHCIIEVKKFNPETGERLSVPRIQKFGKKAFETTVETNLKKQGYTITILHEPSEVNIQAQAKQPIDANAKRKAEIDAAVAEALQKQSEAHKAEIDAAVKAAVAETIKQMSKGSKPGRKAKDAETVENGDVAGDNDGEGTSTNDGE